MRWYANAREVGSGERVTVVLAHGYGVKQSSWDALLPSISHANRVRTYPACMHAYTYVVYLSVLTVYGN